MKVRNVALLVVACLVAGLVGSNACATGFVMANDVDITVSNNMGGSGSGWYGAQQDQSVAPGCVASQLWDLEGMSATKNTLLGDSTVSMIGGFDFKNGVEGITSGDIFVDTTAGTDNFPVTPNYDYVMHVINWNSSNIQYDVYQVNSGSVFNNVTYSQNAKADPWTYASGGTLLNGGQLYNITYQSGLSDADTGFLGDLVADKNGPSGDDFQPAGPSHYAASFDLAWLSPLLPQGDVTVGFHFTEQCGNDTLNGEFPVQNIITPEPASLLLMALAVGGFVARRAVRGRLA